MKALATLGMFTGLVMAGMDSGNFTAMLSTCTAGLCLFLGSAWILTRR